MYLAEADLHHDQRDHRRDRSRRVRRGGGAHQRLVLGTNGSRVLRHDPSPKAKTVPPMEIDGLPEVTQVSMGSDRIHSPFVGQLGDGALIERLQPARVPGVSTRSLRSTHALIDGGTVTCWGSTDGGEIGTYATAAVTDWVALKW